jgi:hypothetical protein
VFDANEGFRFEPGDKVLVQIHYHLHHVGQIGAGDQSALAFQTEQPNPSIHELLDAVAAAPVELPCPANAHGALCDRSAELADQARQYGPSGPLVELGLNLACGDHTTTDPRTGNGTSRCDLPVAVSGHIINVMGHMHTRGATIRLTVNPGTPRQRVLLDVPHWSFGWQLTYQPISPVPIQAGDTLRIQCSWDRSQVYDPNPHYIVFAEGTEDEMCFATYTIDPLAPSPSH